MPCRVGIVHPAKGRKTMRSILNDLSLNDISYLWNEGYTKKEIANRLGVGYSTICRYTQNMSKRPQNFRQAFIKESTSVHDNAEAQKKVEAEEQKKEIVPAEIIVPAEQDFLPVIQRHQVREMQGSVCVFKTDSDSDFVELLDVNGGTIAGIIDYQSIPKLVKELQYLYERK